MPSLWNRGTEAGLCLRLNSRYIYGEGACEAGFQEEGRAEEEDGQVMGEEV
jgi:hypothetical protein